MIYLKRSAISFVLLALFIYLIVGGAGMMIQARLFTLAVGIAGVSVIGIHLVYELLATAREVKQEHQVASGEQAKTENDVAGGADFAITDDELTRSGRIAALEQFFWLWGLVGGLWLVGFYVAVPSLMALYLIRYRENYRVILPLSAGIWLAVWGLFDKFLNLPFPKGQLWVWLGF